MIICTMTTGSHLHRAKVLAKSVKKHHPDARMALCYMEKNWHPEAQRSMAFDYKVLVSDIGIPDFNRFMYTRRVDEASYALKGHFLRYLFRKYPNETEFLFLDTDTKVMGRMEELEHALREYPIVVTPHLLQDADLSYLQHGLYNVGFLALRREEESERFLDWWTERTDRYCYGDQYGNGIFYEQNWLNLAPSYFNTFTLEHPGYNVAYWNLHERNPIKREASGVYTVGGVPLKLVHYSHLEGDMLSSMNAHIGDRQSGLYVLRNVYIRELRQAGQSRLRKLRWSYDFSSNGKPISRTDRIRYRSQPNLRNSYSNPFASSNMKLGQRDGKLRIVQVLSNSPNALPVPPMNQGGTEKIAYELTEELVRRGHEVYLYAAGGSRSSAILKEYPRGLAEKDIGLFVVNTMPSHVDIIHDHSFSSAIVGGSSQRLRFVRIISPSAISCDIPSM